ncbi:MAG TPA: ubiquinone/menaquinone biosynthesis methyltransferase [Candidatus Polarisedimenticolia bacterium]|nr:ubiquinone/menaquinone biosynthesis methyltransferase [Candidatus Polarisedimenticolia bacterium]
MLTQRNLEIRDNFDAIAPRYDLTNRVISFGVDLHWRRAAIRRLEGLPRDGVVLDLACGTCDMALEVLRQRRAARVVGADLSRAMLDLARRKLAARRRPETGGAARGAAGAITLVNAPAEALPFRDGSFDGVTIAFGIRNVPDYRAGLREMARVLKRGGRACVLEFSTPPSRLLWKMYHYYFFNVLPRLGGLLTGREAAYRYLTESVAHFPGPGEFRSAMEEAGFTEVSQVAMNGGIVCVHTGVRP